MAEKEIRVRFAPSPTGELHMGSVRTALFNYLFAKANKGKMILRIEDTDEKRSTEESLHTIINGLRWMGLDWDEGPEKGGISPPYYQSQRIEIHREYAQKLIDAGKTYYCNCSGGDPTSPCKCFEKNQEEIKNSPDAAVRFKVPPGTTEIDDKIRGQVVFNNEDIVDFIILKSNGHPVYNFAVVVDDITMGVTHIIRGEDHLSNAPKQIMLYKALGVEPPVMAHQPLIHSPLGGKLSKRQLAKPQNEPDSPKYVPAVNVEWYRDHGFLPEAFLNYLTKLCWSDGTDREFYTLKELEENFKLEDISPTSALYDWNKLKWFNGMYLRKMSTDDFVAKCLPFLNKAFGDKLEQKIQQFGEDWPYRLLVNYQERVEYFDEIGEKTGFYFERPTEFNSKDIKKVKWDNEAKSLLQEYLLDICHRSDFTIDSLEEISKKFIEDKNIKPGRILQVVRLAVSGTRATPGIYDVLSLLGEEEVRERLKYFIENVEVIQQ